MVSDTGQIVVRLHWRRVKTIGQYEAINMMIQSIIMPGLIVLSYDKQTDNKVWGCQNWNKTQVLNFENYGYEEI